MSLYRWCVLIGLFVSGSVFSQSAITGIVYGDANHNGNRDHGESGIPDVALSNGRDVVRTDRDGRWKLSLRSDSLVFLIKPSGFEIQKNELYLPQHYRSFAGGSSLYPAGEMAFPLQPNPENDRFTVLLFGDPQARGVREVDFVTRDVVQECIGIQAEFGICLGDLVADDPMLFAELSQSFSQIGIPWYYVFGNHDHDRQAVDPAQRDRTFRRFFGPSTYAFEYAQAVFIILNNVFYMPEGRSRARLTDDQLAFIADYLKTVPKEKLVLLLMHIPIFMMDNGDKVYEILYDRPYSFSVSAHTHTLAHVFLDEKAGWRHAEPHHHFINGAVSGSWWCGLIDEQGIPHAVMNDGSPNGYSLLTIDGHHYSIRYKAARRPADYQMNIYLPDEIRCDQVDSTKILVNVFAGSSRTIVEARFGMTADWQPLAPVAARDTDCLAMNQLNPYLEQSVNGTVLEEIFGWKMDPPSLSRHMWEGSLPTQLKPGTLTVSVRARDMFGQTDMAHRILRIRP